MQIASGVPLYEIRGDIHYGDVPDKHQKTILVCSDGAMASARCTVGMSSSLLSVSQAGRKQQPICL
jgi:hypothetical protein